MNETNYSAFNVAQWFINRANEDVAQNGGEYLTHLKLQKLLYYAQGCYIAITKRPLFNEDIYAWTHGPVVKDVYGKYAVCGDKAIENVESVDIDNETRAILEEVYNVFGQYSAWKLRNMTHEEKPWRETEQSQIIPIDLIKDYFEQHVIEE